MTCFKTFKTAVIVFVTFLAAEGTAAHELSDEESSDAFELWQQPEDSSMEDYIDSLIRGYSKTGEDPWLEALEVAVSNGEFMHPQDSLFYQAWLAQATHDFTAARQLVDQLTNRYPNHTGGWLLSVSIAKTQADLDLADQGCTQLSARASMEIGLICKANLVTDLKQSERWLELLDNFLPRLANPELAAWGYATAADLAVTLNRYDQAEDYFKHSLSHIERQQVKVAYTDLLIEQQRFEEAMVVVQEHSTSPAIVLRHLIIETALGTADKNEIREIDRLFRDWAAEEDLQHAREMAMFYLYVVPDNKFALHLAKKNYEFQKELEDVRLLKQAELAWQSSNG